MFFNVVPDSLTECAGLQMAVIPGIQLPMGRSDLPIGKKKNLSATSRFLVRLEQSRCLMYPFAES